MDCIKAKVNAELKAGNIGTDTTCKYNPCHEGGQNCSFCYCPFYPCNDEDLGRFIKNKKGELVLDCSPCLFCHNDDVVEYSFKRFKELGVKDADDPRIMDVFVEAKNKFFRK